MGKTELAVVGAGPAGLSASIAAARSGAQVTLVDECTTPGGQYLKGASRPTPTSPPFATERKGRALLREVAELDLDLRLGTLVWGIEDRRLALHSPQGPDWLEAETTIVATGARELVIPFPGWTLPGVMTLGGAQILAKEHGVSPGRRLLLAGSGPLLLPVADELTRRGVEVVAVLEASFLRGWPRYAPAVWGNWDRLREGWTYLHRLRRARVPYRLGWTVVRALGETEIEAAVVARLDRGGHPIPGSEERVAVDTLCLGFGFLPNVELTQLAGCVHEFDPARGGLCPEVNERLETSVSGLFAAGETAGVGGAKAAILEGRIAGLAAAQRLGHIRESQLSRELEALAPQRRRLGRFGAMLNTLFRPRPGLDTITTDDTLICRCEEISAGEVRAAVARGALELDALKTWTRVGQGPCQGRTCGPLLARLLAREKDRPPAEAGSFHVRPPLKPVPLGDLALRHKAYGETQVTPQKTGADLPPRSQWAGAGAGGKPATPKADVVVIGGGIVGAACAYYLCAAGLDVHLVERRFPASGTSRACDGLILLWDKSPGAELELGQASAALWADLAEALNLEFEYARTGSILVTESQEGVAAARATVEAMGAGGVRAEALDGPGLRRLEPNLAPDLAGGAFFPDDAQVDARRATLALLSAAQRRGLTLHTQAEVVAIRRMGDGGGSVGGVVTRVGEIGTEKVVCAAGVWSQQVARLVRIEAPIRPRKGQILVTSKVPGLIQHPLLEGGYTASVQSASQDLQVAFVAEKSASGALLLGSSRQFAGFDRSASSAVMEAIAARALRFLPSLAQVGVIRSYAGLRPWSPDHLPLIGPVEAVPGFYLAAGHEGAGIGLAPITGRLIADWVVGADLPPVAPQVRPDRFELINTPPS